MGSRRDRPRREFAARAQASTSPSLALTASTSRMDALADHLTSKRSDGS
jgi:hypothetical protein